MKSSTSNNLLPKADLVFKLNGPFMLPCLIEMLTGTDEWKHTCLPDQNGTHTICGEYVAYTSPTSTTPTGSHDITSFYHVASILTIKQEMLKI